MQPDTSTLLAQIEEQRQLSHQAGQAIFKALSPIYYPDTSADLIKFGEIGSYGRGTNTDPLPDIDVMFLGLPKDPSRGWVDWTETSTYAIVANHNGLTDIARIWTIDAKLVEAISATRKSLEEAFECKGETKFNWVRSWPDFPGVVYNVSAPIQGFGQLEFDVNLYHRAQYFGIEHSERFNRYLSHVQEKMGGERAAQLILEIRQLKEGVKRGAKIPITKSLDRSKKVTGIIPECLFTSTFPPYTFAEVRDQINKIATITLPNPDPDCDYTQDTQIVNSGMSPLEVVHSFRKNGVLTDGGWRNLRAALQ
jgi:hypothetical protein